MRGFGPVCTRICKCNADSSDVKWGNYNHGPWKLFRATDNDFAGNIKLVRRIVFFWLAKTKSSKCTFYHRGFKSHLLKWKHLIQGLRRMLSFSKAIKRPPRPHKSICFSTMAVQRKKKAQQLFSYQDETESLCRQVIAPPASSSPWQTGSCTRTFFSTLRGRWVQMRLDQSRDGSWSNAS